MSAAAVAPAEIAATTVVAEEQAVADVVEMPGAAVAAP
eukprot:CAMPEP_0115329512 /NCGR_PEP_ID=MMETSP0270-20121206/85270_1 /TAXON_ID=71861 /ORGANISM="Scrippsiella trochoidea, Strain CCMP3099" /LENGTH=37 /DNA_ID= /DNA_START= /DNA_END= /DNA_ORIENTATION=